MTAKSADNRKLVPAVAIVVALLLMGLLLRLEGRMFICACGEFKAWISDTCSSNNSQQLFDPYSFTHILHGFLLFWLIRLVLEWPRLRPGLTPRSRLAPMWQLWLALALEAAWEVFENTKFVIDRYRAETAALGYTGDTIVNSFGDLACALAGFLVARQLGLRWSLLLFVVLEIVLGIWIRDSLVLQIVMLIKPVEAIKLWQMCH